MIRAVAIAVALACFGCASRDHVLLVDPAFDAADRAAIQRAVDKWNGVSDVPIALTDDSGAADGAVLRSDVPLGAQATELDGIIRIGPGYAPADLEGLALHELGHVLGLGHTGKGIMTDDGNLLPTEFAATDLEECRRVGSCHTQTR